MADKPTKADALWGWREMILANKDTVVLPVETWTALVKPKPAKGGK